MKQLTQAAFQRAKNFIMDHGRTLDQRRFEFHFENGSADAVLAALSPLAAELKDEVEMNLDFEIEQQGEDGSWSPNFSWDDQYPEAWRTAKKEWKSRLTVDILKTLKDFGRIA